MAVKIKGVLGRLFELFCLKDVKSAFPKIVGQEVLPIVLRTAALQYDTPPQVIGWPTGQTLASSSSLIF
jgi:hypothetical protein